MVMIVIADVTSPRERGKYLGSLGAVFGVASVVGPLVGGAFVDKASWRWCFWINLPICAIAIVIVVVFLHLPHQGTPFLEGLKLMDLYGILTITCGVVTLLLPLSWGGSEYAWDSPLVIVLFIVAALFACAFVYIEMKVAKNPVIPMGLFKIRNFVVS